MGSVPALVSFLLMVMSGWVYPHQLIGIESLQEVEFRTGK